MRKKIVLTHLAALLILASVAGGLWVQRVHVDRPDKHGMLNLDIIRYWYPVAVHIRGALHEGRLPLWNPYQYAGIPFLALQMPGALYPPNQLLMASFRPARALEAHALFHMVVAGFFTWLLAARLGLSMPARMAAALAFTLAPALRHGFYMVSYLSTLAWIPAVFWAVHGLMTEARARWALALSLSLSMSFLGGYAQGFLYLAQSGFLYGLFCFAFLARSGLRLRALATAMLAAALTFGLIALQLFPTLELVRLATRTFEGLGLYAASWGAVRPEALLEGLFGSLGKHQSLWKASTLGLTGVSFLSLPMLLCGLAARRCRSQWVFFVSAGILSALFMLGAEWGVFGFYYYQLPLGGVFRNPSRMSYLYAFFVSVIIGIGVQGVCELLIRRGIRRFAVVSVGVLLTVIVGLDLFSGSRLIYAHPVLSPERKYAPTELIEGLRVRKDFGRVFIDDGWRLSSTRLQAKAGTMNRLFVVPDYEPILPRAYAEYFDIRTRGPWHARLNVLNQRQNAVDPGFFRLLDLMSVRYYVVLPEGNPVVVRRLAGLVGNVAMPAGDAYVVKRESALPRTYHVHRTIHEPDDARALDRLRSASFRPRQEAVVSEPILPLGDPPDGDGESAAITSYEPEKIVIEATCASPCLLVLTDLHYPGWMAYVDGEESSIYRVNTLYRGLRLEAGSHEIVYHYRPRSFRIGSLISLGTLALIALGLVFTAVRRRSRNSRASA